MTSSRSDQRVQFRVLGPLETVVDGQPVELPPKVRTLLAVLLVHRGEVVSGDALADALWGESPPTSWATMLHGYVSQLRSKLEPGAVATRPPGYLLTVEPDTIDAWAFEDLLSQGRAALNSGQPEEAARLLSAAQAHWRGPALGEHAEALFAQAEAARLEELRLVGMEELIEAELDLGRHNELVGTLRTLVDAHPLRERLWGQLILALYRSERSAEALRTYAELRRRLAEEFGIDPGPALRQLEEDVLLQRPHLAWQPPAPVSEIDVPSNLPTSPSSFVGREQELGELDKLLAFGLVTMMGPGGVGKTRLAIETAREVRFRYPDGVWLVELAPVSEPSLVPHAVARAIGVVEEPGRSLTETLGAALAPKRCLLVLDNCEHVVEAAASLSDALLSAAPNLALLATSREPLRVEGELLWATPSLPVAPIDDLPPEVLARVDSVRLFCERAAAQSPFHLTFDNASVVSRLCRRLDGIPLAIELAAARTAALSPAQILDRLDHRFRLLTAGRRNVPRHETLRAAVEWSHDLLSDDERTLFRRLSVFRGFPLEGAKDVCPDDRLDRTRVAALLADLVDRSLVVPRRQDDGLRYSLLETLRVYADERLREAGEEHHVRRRHLDWLAELAKLTNERQWSHAAAPDAGDWEKRMQTENDNAREAFTWALANDPPAALALVRDLALHWAGTGYVAEGRRWAAAALAAGPDAPPVLRAWALRRGGTLANHEGDYEAGRPMHEEAVTIFRALDEKEALAGTLIGGFGPSVMERDLRAARAIFEEGLSVATEVGANKWVAWATGCLAIIAGQEGDFDRAERLMAEALAGFRHLGSGFDNWQTRAAHLALSHGDLERAGSLFREGLASQRARGHRGMQPSSLCGISEIALIEGDLDLAESCLEEVLDLGRETGRSMVVAAARRGMAWVALRRGDVEGARALVNQALAENRPPTLAVMVSDLRIAAAVALAEGRWELAAELLAATQRLRVDAGAPIAPVYRPQFEDDLALLRSTLDVITFDEAWTRGWAMTSTEAIDRAHDRFLRAPIGDHRSIR